MNKKTLIVAVALAAQVAAIGWLIWRYERVVCNGTEVRFKCQAYDPYDPLRGRYLRMTVNERTACIPSCVSNTYEHSDKFVVRVEPSTNGLWCVAEAAFAPTDEGLWVKPRSSHVDHRITWADREKDEEWEQFDKRRNASGLVVEASFPDQLFVNEKLAPAAEKLLREKVNDAVAVYRVLNGEIVLTGIEIEGKPILDQVRKSE